MSCPYANKCWRYSYSKYYFEIGYEIPPERQVLFFAGYASEEMFPHKGIFAENMPARGKNICPQLETGSCLNCFEYKKESKRILHLNTIRRVGSHERIYRPPIAKEIRYMVARRCKYKCVYCNRPINTIDSNGNKIRGVIDHVYPVALGGSSDESNLALACHPCNVAKAAYIGTLEIGAGRYNEKVWYPGCRVNYY